MRSKEKVMKTKAVDSALSGPDPQNSAVSSVFRGLRTRPSAGVYVVHKPAGPSSYAVCETFQAALAASPGKALKLCHGGTLDPFATGTLLILVGAATKLFEHLHALPKTYEVEAAWGAETDSLDTLGQRTEQSQHPKPTRQQLVDALERHRGFTSQVPPNTSNKRVGKERAYRLAHRGEVFTLPPSEVYLHDFTVHSGNRFSVTVKGGFYLRSLVRDLGRGLGCLGAVHALHRTAIGPFSCLSKATEQAFIGEAACPWWPTRTLSDAEVGRLRKGESIALGHCRPARFVEPLNFPKWPELVAGFHQQRLVSVLAPVEGQLEQRLFFSPGF